MIRTPFYVDRIGHQTSMKGGILTSRKFDSLESTTVSVVWGLTTVEIVYVHAVEGYPLTQ